MNPCDNPFAVSPSGARTYQTIRPDYPEAVIAHLTRGHVQCVADIGAGTGIFTRQLAQRLPAAQIYAVEPALAMQQAWEERPANVSIVTGSAEATGLESGSVDLVTWAQSFHWIDRDQAALETTRILSAGGKGAVVANQMDVGIPWVHRLTRIMRSGDVLSLQRPPRLPGFETANVLVVPWVQSLTPRQVLELARTRSSYLRSNEDNRLRMQSNLSWYLRDHLGYQDDDQVQIPYQTFLWELLPQ